MTCPLPHNCKVEEPEFQAKFSYFGSLALSPLTLWLIFRTVYFLHFFQFSASWFACLFLFSLQIREEKARGILGDRHTRGRLFLYVWENLYKSTLTTKCVLLSSQRTVPDNPHLTNYLFNSQVSHLDTWVEARGTVHFLKILFLAGKSPWEDRHCFHHTLDGNQWVNSAFPSWKVSANFCFISSSPTPSTGPTSLNFRLSLAQSQKYLFKPSINFFFKKKVS